MARNGKIARLPRAIRDELNRRLQDGERGKVLLAWLNDLPRVRQILARDFGGLAVNKQNLSDWRKGGFKEWQVRQEALAQTLELAADAREIAAVTDGRLTDHLATMLAVKYAALLAGWGDRGTDELRRELQALRGVCQDIVALRRGDHSGARLKMEQERLDSEREKTEEEVVAHFQRWISNPAVREAVCQSHTSQEERERRTAEIFGLEARGGEQPKISEAAINGHPRGGQAGELRSVKASQGWVGGGEEEGTQDLARNLEQAG